MDEDFFRSDFGPPRRQENLFAWTVFILLLLALALSCWIGSFYVFGHPESPRSYRILQKLKKIPPLKRFELTAAPPGKFLNPQELYEKYNAMSRLDLQHENDELMRNYINNYSATKRIVPYVIGRFNILDSYELKKGDLFESGVVAVAQSVDFPQIMIEHVYTSAPKSVPMLRRMLQTGLDIRLEKTLDLAAIVHIEKVFEGRLQITVVPLLYGSYALKQASGTFSLEPPLALNLEAGAPIVRGDELQGSLKTFAEYRRGKPAAVLPTASATPPPMELVKMDTAPVPEPVEESTPVPVTAQPSPTSRPNKIAQSAPSPNRLATAPINAGTPVLGKAVPALSPTILAANSTPRPTPPPRIVSTPTPAVPAPAQPTAPPSGDLPPGVALKPFLESRPEPKIASSGASWRTFSPGQMPKGRVVEPQDADEIADRGVGGERVYLRGEFVVTAAGENRAVLRMPGGGTGRGSVRVIAEFPAGTEPPAEGATFARDDARPFQVTDVRRGADGQVNMYVREITTP